LEGLKQLNLFEEPSVFVKVSGENKRDNTDSFNHSFYFSGNVNKILFEQQTNTFQFSGELKNKDYDWMTLSLLLSGEIPSNNSDRTDYRLRISGSLNGSISDPFQKTIELSGAVLTQSPDYLTFGANFSGFLTGFTRIDTGTLNFQLISGTWTKAPSGNMQSGRLGVSLSFSILNGAFGV
jgi:hypothetical protein